MPAITVILPNFNHAKFLKQRISSILNQSFADFELLIFDDASTDGSVSIIHSFEDPRISHIETRKVNSGSPFGFWEKGISMAKGEIIWIAESDDYAHNKFLETLSQEFKKDQSLQIAYCGSHWVNEKNEIIHSPAHECESMLLTYNKAIHSIFLKGPVIYNASSALFKKEAVANIDFKKLKSFKYAGDWFFWSSFQQKGSIKRVSERLNYFRRHDNNVSFQAEKDGLDLKEGLQIVGRLLDLNKISFTQKHKALAYWAMKVYRSSLPEKRKYLASLPSEIKLWYALAPILSKIYA